MPSYIATNLNPADIASRGCSLSQVKQWTFWLNGPAFLREPRSASASLNDSSSAVGSDVSNTDGILLNSVISPCDKLASSQYAVTQFDTGFLSRWITQHWIAQPD